MTLKKGCWATDQDHLPCPYGDCDGRINLDDTSLEEGDQLRCPRCDQTATILQRRLYLDLQLDSTLPRDSP